MRTKFCVRALAGLFVLLMASVASAQRDFYVTGSFQTPDPWDPDVAPLMTETAPGSGIYETLVTGLTEATQYNFKILEDLDGGGVDFDECGFGNPCQITGEDSWFINVGTSGETTIRLDTTDYSTLEPDWFPQINRVIIDEDIATWNAVGDFMEEAGGLANWDNADTLFTMVDQGSGLFTLDATIATAGNYQWRAVNTGTFTGIATDQRRANNGDNYQFFTVENDQEVTFKVDTTRGAISFETDTFLDGDTNNNGFVEYETDPGVFPDFGPIRDNWLENTFLRSEGDLVPDGIVDVLDFRQWKDACLAIDCASESQIAQAFNSLPEPASGSLLLFALAGMAMVRRRR